MVDDPDVLAPFWGQLTPAARAAAGQLLHWARQNDLLPASVGFHAGGGVWIEWGRGCKELRVLIHADGVMEYLLHGQTDRAVEVACQLLQAALGSSSRW
jgi:hypothetical protein